jgi:D-alanine-D-alanine ligase
MKNLLLICGGASAESEVSIASCENISSYIDRTKFNVISILILNDKTWVLKETGKLVHVINKNGRGVLLVDDNDYFKEIDIDVIFPILHGKGVEDGQIQGFFETLNIPYVGSKVLSSALCFDKILAKTIVRAHGISVVNFVEYSNEMSYEKVCELLQTKDLFIKPSNSGSTFGVSKASNAEEFDQSIALAKKFDDTVLIEKYLPNVRELFCTIFQDTVCDIVEVVIQKEFFDFEDKYSETSEAKVLVHKNLEDDLYSRIQTLSLQIFKILRCHNFSRCDFLLSESGELFFSEVNSIPGMGTKSLMLSSFMAMGYDMHDIVSKMIEVC